MTGEFDVMGFVVQYGVLCGGIIIIIIIIYWLYNGISGMAYVVHWTKRSISLVANITSFLYINRPRTFARSQQLFVDHVSAIYRWKALGGSSIEQKITNYK